MHGVRVYNVGIDFDAKDVIIQMTSNPAEEGVHAGSI